VGVGRGVGEAADTFRADLVVLAASALNTPTILLRSASSLHPRGLRNGSKQVGRNLMQPQLTPILKLASDRSSGRFARCFGVNGFYCGDRNVSYPLGHVQSAGGVLEDATCAESPPVLSSSESANARRGTGAVGATFGGLVGHELRCLPAPITRCEYVGIRSMSTTSPTTARPMTNWLYRWVDTLSRLWRWTSTPAR